MAQALQRMQKNWQQALGEVEARGVGVNLTFDTHYRSQLNLILLLKIDDEKSLYSVKCQISVYIYIYIYMHLVLFCVTLLFCRFGHKIHGNALVVKSLH